MIPIFSIIEKYQKYAMGEIDLSKREKRIFNEVLLEPFKSKMICPICGSNMTLNKNRWYICTNKNCEYS